MTVDSPEVEAICACAGKNKISVMLGYSENYEDLLYLAQSFICKDGQINMNRRKIKPTHVERTLYGDGSGASLLNLVDEPGVGKGEEIHVAAWPPMNYFNSFPEGSALWS
ncbi:hypothetical protein SLS63_006217 [Diaporthe eres]|uniref:nitrilase n=1 Tax=Diaporthe eres TaxID=83184 RepID=A0ABR1P8W4_DIAER